MLYKQIKNLGGGYTYEFMNAIANFIEAVRDTNSTAIKTA